MLNKHLQVVIQKGFTLVEVMIVVLLLALILNFAVPELSRFFERNRLKAAAEEVYSQIHYARSETIKQSTPLFMRFVANNTSTWSFGIDTATGCTPTDALGGANPCTIMVGATAVRKAVVNGADEANFTNIKMSLKDSGGTTVNPFEIAFDQVRGTATAGTITLTSPNGWIINNVVSVLGHVKVCSPSGAGKISGYPAC